MSEKSKVIIEVRGGVAEATQVPDNVEVEIIDHDNDIQQDIDPLYDVVVFRKDTKVIDAVVGKRLRYDTGHNNALKRLDTIKSRINFDYDAAIVQTGTYKEGDEFKEDGDGEPA